METLSRHAKIQTSETFLLSAILALSGGFQDAYTYNVRNGVFSNAQTGNVVLMSQHLMEGNWDARVALLVPGACVCIWRTRGRTDWTYL